MADPLEAVLQQVFGKYRALDRNKDKFAVRQMPDAGDGRQLEYYPPQEEWNPFPGKATVELYNSKVPPDVLQNLIAGDMMHYMGGSDASGQPNDQTFSKLKQQLLTTMTPEQGRINKRAYESEKKFYDTPPPFEDWMQDNRGDAYIRGKLTPDADDNWRNIYTPQQDQILKLIDTYMKRGSIAPGMNR